MKETPQNINFFEENSVGFGGVEGGLAPTFGVSIFFEGILQSPRNPDVIDDEATFFAPEDAIYTGDRLH